ncbi:MAG: accessory factor UbiK family protein [Burkholderiaceae bacterium]
MATDKQNLLNDMQSRISDFFRSSPLGDIERNVKAVVAQTFQRMDLVTQEEFQIQGELLEQLRQRVDELEAVIQRLEASGDGATAAAEAPPAGTTTADPSA